MSHENFKDSNKATPGPGQSGYKDTVNDKPIDQRVPQTSLPKAPDPSPFSFGGGGSK